MINESFDDKSDAIINPIKQKVLVKCDICIATFSDKIERFVIEQFIHKICNCCRIFNFYIIFCWGIMI